MSKKIVIFHKVDLDGWMSAAIVKKKYPDVELIGWDYGEDNPMIYDEEKYTPGENEFAIGSKEKVIMVDIAFDPEVMIYLRERAVKPLSFIWIDHHKSAIMDSIKHNYQGVAGTRDMEFAACELTWKYFFPDDPVPESVELLGLYDSFRHKTKSAEIQKRVMQFQYAARAYWFDPISCARALRDGFNVEPCIQSGKAIFAYLEMEALQIYAKGFPITLKEIIDNKDNSFIFRKFICVNRERFNPANFGIDYHKDGYDGAACFWYQDGKWHWSLYNANGKVDVSEICKEYGGGGHPGAAGYTEDSFHITLPKP